MQLTIFNGSPRPGASNTQLLIESLVEGFEKLTDRSAVVYKLSANKAQHDPVGIFREAELVLIAFPLYSLGMPGNVMSFFEALEPLTGRCAEVRLGFLVQYGFREAVHARPLERYLEGLAKRLGCEYLGTIIKGGCDGLIQGPRRRFSGIYRGIEAIGATLAERGEFDSEELRRFSQPETAPRRSVWLMRIFVKLLNRYYWGRMLTENGVSLEESFARPCLDDSKA